MDNAKSNFTISLHEAKVITRRLETDASYDKVGSIYYRIKAFIRENEEIGISNP